MLCGTKSWEILRTDQLGFEWMVDCERWSLSWICCGQVCLKPWARSVWHFLLMTSACGVPFCVLQFERPCENQCAAYSGRSFRLCRQSDKLTGTIAGLPVGKKITPTVCIPVVLFSGLEHNVMLKLTDLFVWAPNQLCDGGSCDSFGMPWPLLLEKHSCRYQ